MNKTEKITGLTSPKDIERVDNLFNLIFQQAQNKEFTRLEFTGAGVWPSAAMIPERGVIICENTTDAEVRLYTKLAGNLKKIVFT